MNRSEFQSLLGHEESPKKESLPERFGSDVLRRGKRLRQLVRRHWRWLRFASLVALGLAITIAVGFSKLSSQESRPPLRLFQSDGVNNPFSPK